MVTTIVKAIYEDGVFKPLEPLELPEHEIVEVHLAAHGTGSRVIAKLGGIWAQYLVGDSLSFEEIEELTAREHKKSLERLLRQVDGDFDEDDDISG